MCRKKDWGEREWRYIVRGEVERKIGKREES